MASSAEERDDETSAHEAEESVRRGRDSSNDADTYEDSSGEGSQFAWVRFDSDACTAATNSKVSPSNAASSQPAGDDSDSSTSDESCLVMVEEERSYHEQHRDATQSQLESLKCTICSCQLFLVNPENIRFHPALGVLICKACREFYSNGPFTKDENGYDEFCRWCAEGGKMICCDTCTNVFCKACLRRCLGRAALTEIQSPGHKWSCLSCNNEPIWAHRTLSRVVLHAMQRKSSRRKSVRKSSAGSNSDPSIWLPAIIAEAERIATYCKSLAAKVGNNWAKEEAGLGVESAQNSTTDKEANKQKVINCCRKLRKAVVTTRFNMKLLEKKMVTRYSEAFGNEADITVDFRSDASSSAASVPSEKSNKRLLLKINFRKGEGTEKKDYYSELRGSSTPSPTSRKAASIRSNGSIHSAETVKAQSPQNQIAALSQEETVADQEMESFFDACSTLPDEKLVEEEDPLERLDHGSGGTIQVPCQKRFVSENEELDLLSGNKLKQSSPSPTNANKRVSDIPLSPILTAKTDRKPSRLSLSRLNTSKDSFKLELTPDTVEEKPIGEKPAEEKPMTLESPKANVETSVDLNEKARRELLMDDSSDDESSDGELLRRKKVRSKAKDKTTIVNLDDPKLQAGCEVKVIRLTDPEAALAEELEKSAKKKSNLLSKLTVKEKVKSAADGSSSESDAPQEDKKETPAPRKNSKPKSEKNSAAKKPYQLIYSSSSSSDSDFERETPMEAEAVEVETEDPFKSTLGGEPSPLDENEAARAELLASSSSDNDSDMDVDLLPKAAEKEVGTKKTKDETMEKKAVVSEDEDGTTVVNESDVEEGPSKPLSEEKQKANKLLRTNLLDSDDESEATKEKPEKEEEKPVTKKAVKKEKKSRRINSDSDFETPDDSDEEKGKKKKKKKQLKRKSSDETEVEEDEEDGDSKPKRKRRRIKKTVDSSEEASSDSDVQILNESQRSDPGGSKGRKNIKKIIKDQNLKDETKKAAKEEEARKKRIAERQKMYNAAFVGDLALINARTDKLVLDFDPETKKELVTVHNSLVTKLKPHQVKGVKFMWDACFESIERIKKHEGSGCILAHCMGLGKSLQVVTLVHTVLSHEDCKVKSALIVCPLSTVLNWQNEFNIWLKEKDGLQVDVYELTSVKSNELRAEVLHNWHNSGGVMIMGYEMYRNLSNPNNKTIKIKNKRLRDALQTSLVDPGPDLVVCDEGHTLKNESTALSKAMNRLKTKRRVILTGTPLQNNLEEYHCMIQFVKPNLLGTKKEFTNRFANPIKNGQTADSTDQDVRLMKRRAHVLHKMLEDSVQRFDYSVLTPFLPPKHEYVISVKMSELQIKMYQYYLEHHAKGGPTNVSRGKGAGLFADFQELGRVWTHPKALLLAQINRDMKAMDESDADSLKDFIVDDRSTPVSEDGGVVCLDESDDEDNEGGKTNGWKARTRAGRGDKPPPEDELGVTAPVSSSWWSQFVNDDDMTNMEHSGKLVLLMDILRQCELIGDKILVFSQSLVSLDLIEEFLAAEDARNEDNRAALAATKELGKEKLEQIGTWRKNADYFRLDGQTTTEYRQKWCDAFNSPSNLRARLFLISTRAGGLGINLVAANRVIIFDASWNPSHDVQSIFRIYRFGQKKPCYVYRFLAQGTMEEKIYDRQVTKLSLACRVVDEHQIERHFNSADLNELYVFDPNSHLRRPTPLMPKDRMLAELTIQRKDWVVTYHEHDSLLENKSEEELTESERKAAWEDFENEKRGVSHMANMMQYPSSLGNSIMPGFQEILNSLAGRSVAGIPLSSIAAMIYNSNPGITQDEFLGRLRLTVDQLQTFSVQQAAAGPPPPAPPPPAPNPMQQAGDSQRLLMQRQAAQEQLRAAQSSSGSQATGAAGPSWQNTPPPPARRGRPPIGPHQRTDLYGHGSVLASSLTARTQNGGTNGGPDGNPPPRL